MRPTFYFHWVVLVSVLPSLRTRSSGLGSFCLGCWWVSSGRGHTEKMLLSDSRLFFHCHWSSMYSMFSNCKCGKQTNKQTPKHICLPLWETGTRIIWLNLLRSFLKYHRGMGLEFPILNSFHQLSQFVSRRSFSPIPPLLPLKKYKVLYFLFVSSCLCN